MAEPVQVTVPAELGGKKLDEVLAALVPDHSRAFLQKLVRRGRVRVDGDRVLRSNVRVRAGARIAVRSGEAAPRPASRLAVLHADEHLVVVDKPPGLLTHGGEGLSTRSVAAELVERFGRLPLTLGDDRPGIVHRLDRDTSGVLVAARTPEALDDLREQFRARQVEKTYLALVHGVPTAERFACDSPLEPGGAPSRERIARPGRGKPALTRFELVERYRGFALLRCFPETGRRHQIRLHLLRVGHPLLGDPIYRRGGEPPAADGPPLARQALHASRLAFRHPAGGARVAFESPLPPDLDAALAWLRRRAS